jgi:hypothetical protein
MITNKQFIQFYAKGLNRFTRVLPKMQAAGVPGTYSDYAILPLLIEADAKGISIDSRVPTATRRGKVGLTRAWTMATDAMDELKACVGDHAVVQSQRLVPDERNKRFVRNEYMPLYVEILKKKLGL